MATHLPTGQRQCVAKIRNGPRKGERCGQPARDGATCCRLHLKNPKARAKAEVRAEVLHWGLGDATVDPAETLLRLVSQSARRAEHYARLVQEAYEAAERLRQAHEAHGLIERMDALGPDGYDADGEPADDSPAVQIARADLDRIFTLGGPAALIGQKYSATNTGSVYAVGEAIRGLVELESAERERCASWSAKAVAAGIAERIVRVREREAELTERALIAALGRSGLDEAQQSAIAADMAAELRVLEGGVAS